MTALHTPGPWDVREDYPDILAGEELIACAFGFANDKGMYVHTSTTHANAKLMSAAPDLLAALKALLHGCGAYEAEPGWTAWILSGNDIAAGLAAIAKATEQA